MSDVIPVTFRNKQGARLFGMLHRPSPRCDSTVAIILLSPGVKMRVAPHRLYNKMAERFVALGFPVLRFDFYGLGDSEGEAAEHYLADLYGAIQVGRYVDDTIAAMDWMQRTYGTSQFIASGLCGGAITGLLAAARDMRVTCLMGLAIPVILDGSKIDYTKYITDAQLKGMRDGAIRKLWDFAGWRSWLRFLTFQSNYRLMVRSLIKPLLARFQRTALPIPVATENSPGDNTNPHFAPAFFKMVSTSRHVYLIFAGMDRLLHEFEKKFVERNRSELEPYAAWYDIHVTKDANHIFSFQEWETDMLSRCCTWLRTVSGGSQKTGLELESVDEINRTIA
jgi:uncharacterized protein